MHLERFINEKGHEYLEIFPQDDNSFIKAAKVGEGTIFGAIVINPPTAFDNFKVFDSREDIDKVIKDVKTYDWLEEELKTELIDFLEEMKDLDIGLSEVEKTYKRTNSSDYECLEVHPLDGGTVKIIHYGGKSDIGLFLSTNPHGLGGSNYIRSEENIPKYVQRVKNTVWLTEEEKEQCIKFLEEVVKCTEE